MEILFEELRKVLKFVVSPEETDRSVPPTKSYEKSSDDKELDETRPKSLVKIKDKK